MTTEIEKKALRYLTQNFSLEGWSFSESGVDGFDLWLHKPDGNKLKAELKATEDSYSKPSDVSKNLIFNTLGEKTDFEDGKTIIVRVFLGDSPPTIILVNNALLNKGAILKRDERYILSGERNYGNDAIQILQGTIKER
jgi:hypothetical protein